jgi:maltoporin
MKRDGDSLGIRPVLWSGRTAGKVGLVLLGLLGTSAPRSAKAEGSDPSPHPSQDRVDMFMYGRMGVGWTKTGQLGAGKSLNLGSGGPAQIGGRLEEGDYLQPGLRFHILKGEKEGDTKVDMVMDFQIWSNDGSMLSDMSNGDVSQVQVHPEQAYIQAQNIFTRGLTIWAGARLYRKNDIHIADYFYFDNLPGEGLGVQYKGLDAALMVHTNSMAFDQFYEQNIRTPPANPGDPVKRQRTMLHVGYSFPFGSGSSYVKGLGEFHHVPKLHDDRAEAAPNVDPTDFGWVAGAKLHLDLGRDNFNDFSFRYGGGIANGAADGRMTFQTFGEASADGTYKGAAGIEVVEHFLWNVAPIISLNGYGTFHFNQGASTPAAPAAGAVAGVNKRTDFAVGVRPVFYIHKNFQLLTEATFQVRKDDDKLMGSVVKLSVAPTLVPTGEPGYWTRPHIRAIYTLGLYNQAAQDQLMSGYLQAVGPAAVAHFIGTRAEWWFY